MTDGDGHRYYEDLAVSHVLGGLAASDGQIFRAHLLECETCRARVWELRALAHDLADVERDERRTRAAKAVETKEREEPEAELEVEERTGRGTKIVVGVLLLAVLALAGWNFMLRTNDLRQRETIADLERGAETMQLGVPGQVNRTAEGVEGSVRVRDGHAVILVSGLESGKQYGLYFQDSSDATVHNRWQVATDGRVLVLIELPAQATRIVLTDPEASSEDQPSGTHLFDADLPRVDRGAPTATVAPAG